MLLKRQLFNALTAVFLSLLYQETPAEMMAASDNTISDLYDNLLQREYAGPVVFPNHQVERKAQRSPSLRLRFGRRTDPDMLPSAEKRWFGDVNQKPIRSPSLRLRFGRRSDPSMPLHSNFDLLMNDLADENDADAAIDNNDLYDEYERVVRKPQRLRWGRSVPFEGGDNRLADVENEREQQRQRTEDLFNSLMSNSDKLRNMLLTLRQFDAAENGAFATADDSGEFQREVRKPAPLRLRWGRSTGGRNNLAKELVGGKDQDQQKQKKSQITVNAEKTEEAQRAQGKN